MPGATVTATNIETNVPSATTTNGEGDYSILYLTPGMYTLSVELSGFKKMSREGLEVRIGDRLTVDGVLEVGQMEEMVSVTAEARCSTPQRLGGPGHRRAAHLAAAAVGRQPVHARAPRARRRLHRRPEVQPAVRQRRHVGHRRRRRTGGNEFTLDGSPNMASGRRVAFVPPAGAVSEFKVETASFDAQQGHTAGANVNVTLKSGTNSLKGEAY